MIRFADRGKFQRNLQLMLRRHALAMLEEQREQVERFRGQVQRDVAATQLPRADIESLFAEHVLRRTRTCHVAV